MVVSLTNYMKSVAESEDPRKEILRWAGNTKQIHLKGDRVLVGTYARPSKTEGGVYLSDAVSVEDRWQGMVGLLLACGPAAFKYDGSYAYEGDPPKIGSWCVYKPADGVEIAWRKMSCRIIRSENILATLADPLLVF